VLSWRCPVWRWRELVAGAGMEQENQSFRYRRPVEMGEGNTPGRERENRERQSTDARHWGGPVRGCAGINRRGGGDGRALHRRGSDPR